MSHALVDRLTWNLQEIFHLSHEPRISRFDVFFFFYHPNDEKHKENRYFNFRILPFFFNFRNFAVSVAHAIGMFILIKMHFGFWVSNGQVDRNHVSHSNSFLKNMLYPRQFTLKTENCKYSLSMNKSACEMYHGFLRKKSPKIDFYKPDYQNTPITDFVVDPPQDCRVIRWNIELSREF